MSPLVQESFSCPRLPCNLVCLFRILNKMVMLLYSACLAITPLLRKTCIPVFVCGKPANDSD
jgi:hypothetical protein